MEEDYKVLLGELIRQINFHKNTVNSGRMYTNIGYIPQDSHRRLVQDLKATFNNNLIGIEYYEGAISEGHSYTLDIPYGQKFEKYKNRQELLSKETLAGCYLGLAMIVFLFALPIFLGIVFHSIVLGIIFFLLATCVVGLTAEYIFNKD